MLAHEILREAALVVEAGWSPGAASARNAAGDEIPLFLWASGSASRASINPNAVAFSLYGSVVKVLAVPGRVASPEMWSALQYLAKAKTLGRSGGTNFMHPIIGFNAQEGRTAAEVVELLREVADGLDPEKQALIAGRAT